MPRSFLEHYNGGMDLREKIVEILNERSFEIDDGASKLNVVDATDFEQIAIDISEVLNRDYSIDVDALKPVEE